MTDQDVIPSIPEPVSKQEAINQLIGNSSQELPLQTEEEQQVLPAPSSETETETTPESSAKKTPSKSAKAAQESRELRQAKAEQAKMKEELESLRASKSQVETFLKAQELFKTNPKEAIKLLGGDPIVAYQALTDSYLQNDPEMKQKDPVEEKLKSIDPYLEQLKKREAQVQEQQNQINITAMINNNVTPVIESKKDQLECLYDYFDDGKATPEQIKKAVAKTVFDAADTYYSKNFTGSPKEQNDKFMKEFGNYETYFTRVAEHLESQLEQQLDTAVQHAAKLKKFQNKLQAKPKASNKAEIAATELPVLDPNSSDESTLDQVISSAAKTSQAKAPEWKPSDYNKRAAIEKLLRDNKL